MERRLETKRDRCGVGVRTDLVAVFTLTRVLRDELSLLNRTTILEPLDVYILEQDGGVEVA